MTSSSLITAVAPSDLLGAPSGDLVLRLCNTAQQGRLIRLSASKCSIGAACDDTLRLNGAGVAPAHCLILRGRDQTVVRSWSAATRLNDRPCVDSPLKIGDRLGVGAIELEVIANANSEPIDAESWICLPTAEECDRGLDFAEQKRRLDEQAASLAEQRTSMAREAERFAAQVEQATRESRALEVEKEAFAERQQALSREVNAFYTEKQELSRDREALQIEWQTLDMQLQGVAAERQIVVSQRQSLELQQQRLATEQLALETCRQMAESERRALESQREHVSADATSHAKRMAEQLAAVAAAREAFERQRDHWQSERDQIQARITEELDRCQCQLADLNRLRQEFDHERTAWDERRRMIELELANRCEGLDRQTNELESHDRLVEPRQAASVEPAPRHLANEDETRNEEDVFARLRAYSLLKTESHEPSDLNDAAPKSAANTDEPSDGVAALAGGRGLSADKSALNQHNAAVPTARAADNEESVDDYMVRLLNRMRGASSANEIQTVMRPEPRSAPVATPTAAASPVAVESPGDLKQADVPAPQVTRGPVQLVARSAAPESAVNLKAMRDLANMTTRGAIDRHAHGRWSKAAIGKGIGGFVSFVCGVWLMFSHVSALGILSSVVGFAGVVAGIFWIVQAALLVRNLRLAGRRTNKSLDAEMPAGGLEGASPADEPNAVLQATAADSSTEVSAWTQRRLRAHRAFQNGARRVASTVRRIVEYARRG